MPKFRKKSVAIEAFQMTHPMEDNSDLWPEWARRTLQRQPGRYGAIWPRGSGWFCRTLEGLYKIRTGDYIIQGIKGEICPCKPDVFKETYEEIEERDKL